MAEALVASLAAASSAGEVEDVLDKLYTMVIEKTITVDDLFEYVFAKSGLVPEQMLPFLGLDAFGDILGSVLAGEDGLKRLVVAPISNLVVAALDADPAAWASSERGLLRIVQHIHRLTDTEKHINMLVGTHWIPLLIKRLGDSGVAGAEKMGNAIVESARFSNGLADVFDHRNDELWINLFKKSTSIVKTRVLDVITRILVLSSEAYERVTVTHASLAPWLACLRSALSGTSDDLLFQLAVIQTVAKMIETPLGYKYLSGSGALSGLSASLSDRGTPSFIRSATLDLVSHAASGLDSEVFASLLKAYPGLIEAILMILKEDTTVTESALMALGSVGHTFHGFVAVSASGQWDVLARWMMQEADTNLRVAALHSLAHILDLKIGAGGGARPQDAQSIQAQLEVEALFSSGGFGFSGALSAIKSHEILVRQAAIHVLQNACKWEWGYRGIMAYADGAIVAWLLDRENTRGKPDREWKYGLVEAVVRGSAAAISGSHPESPYMAQLKSYLARGPHYVEPFDPQMRVKTR